MSDITGRTTILIGEAMLWAHLSINENLPLTPLRTISTLIYLMQSHLKIFYFLKSKLLYMGKFHHVETKAIKREQLKHHKILYI